MSILRLLDVSQYIHAGVGNNAISRGISRQGDCYVENSLPCAGLANVLNAYFELKDAGTDIVFCLDNLPLHKRTLYDRTFPNGLGYKGNRRKKSPEISVQRMMVADMLKQCGFCVLGEEGYEADDIIASAVHKYKSSYDKIVIHSIDSDLYYLVSENVECAPVMKRGKVVTRKNWEEVVDGKYVLMYNSITLHKLTRGESSDNVPAVSKEMASRILSAVTPEMYELCGDNVWLRERIKEATGNDEVTMAIFDLIAPIIVDNEVVELYEEILNKEVVTAYAIEVGCHGYRNHQSFGLGIVEDTISKYMATYMGIQS